MNKSAYFQFVNSLCCNDGTVTRTRCNPQSHYVPFSIQSWYLRRRSVIWHDAEWCEINTVSPNGWVWTGARPYARAKVMKTIPNHRQCKVQTFIYRPCIYGDPNLASLVSADVITWWRHQMETFSALLAIRAGNSPVPGEFPTQRPVTRSFDVYFDLRPNKRLSKQS